MHDGEPQIYTALAANPAKGDTMTSTQANERVLKIITPIGYAIGVGGPIIIIVLAILGKLPS